MENLITIDLLKDKECCELAALIDYSRYPFEVIHGHLERLHGRYVKKEGASFGENKSSSD